MGYNFYVDALAALNNVAPTPDVSVVVPTEINTNGKSVENDISILTLQRSFNFEQ